MSVKITIPLSVIFFPITLPIALMRIVVAGVVAVIISPVTFIHGATGRFKKYEWFGYARKYTILETTQYDQSYIYYVQSVRVRPGIIPSIAGAKPKIEMLWNRRYATYSFMSDGTQATPRFHQGVKTVERVAEQAEELKANLDTIRGATPRV